MIAPLAKTARSPLGRRVLVIGAGPAGLFAAIAAARAGARVTALERMPRPGLKLLASGGGHANVTNTLSEPDFIARFGRKGKFMTPALREMSRDALLEALASWGAPCHAPDGFHYFPKSNRASDILAALLRQIAALKVSLVSDARVTELLIENGQIRGARTERAAGADEFTADAVILAAGGAGYGGLGGCRDGFELARRAGHEIVPLVTGLVGVRTRETWPGACAGVVVADAEARILSRARVRDGRARAGQAWRGELLFTHQGISGPCILDASAPICRLLLDQDEVPVQLRIANPKQAEACTLNSFRVQASACHDSKSHLEPGATLLARWRKEHGRKTAHNLMGQFLPRRLAAALCEAEGIASGLTAARLPKEAEKRLIAIFEGPIVHVVGSEGFERAMVTSGGVSLKEVHPSTLESRLVSGLCFAGEVLDLDGPSGGFNLQWAMSSGYLAGKCAAAG